VDETVRHGKGVLTFYDGRKYEGDFAGDMFHGKGVMVLLENEKYEGEFQNDGFDGKG